MWPGLQGASQGGVLQNVLGPNQDGSTWYVGSGYCCNGDPWGNGINLTDSQTLWFNNYDNYDGTWTAQLGLPGQGPSTNDVFALEGYYFYDVFFAIELYDPAAWNFGPLIFSDIVITVLGDDTSFCTNSPAQFGSFTWQASGATPNAHDGVVDCHVDNITLESPKS